MPSEIVEPDFSSEEDLLVMARDVGKFADSIDGLTLKANILLFSYNRPKMIREAIQSVLDQSYGNFDLFIVDDGSDFDLIDLVDDYADQRILTAIAPKISTDQRVNSSRLGSNANAVIETIPDEEPVYYLCDDDIMGPNWLSRSIRTFQMMPEIHVVTGEAWSFNDGEDYLTEATYGMQVDKQPNILTTYWSTGSFGHRALCCKREGLWWTDNRHLHSQDTNFIMGIWKTHSDYGAIATPALFRREHENTLSAKLGRKNEDGKYEIGFLPPPATKEMLEKME